MNSDTPVRDIIDDLLDWGHIIRESAAAGVPVTAANSSMYEDAAIEIEQLRSEVWRLLRLCDDERTLADRLAAALRHEITSGDRTRATAALSSWEEARNVR